MQTRVLQRMNKIDTKYQSDMQALESKMDKISQQEATNKTKFMDLTQAAETKQKQAQERMVENKQTVDTLLAGKQTVDTLLAGNGQQGSVDDTQSANSSSEALMSTAMNANVNAVNANVNANAVNANANVNANALLI